MRHAARRRTAVLATVLVQMLLLTGCSLLAEDEPATARPASATGPVTQDVSPEAALDLELPGVARITAPAGTFATPGTITLTPARPNGAVVSGTYIAGPGVDVAFAGTKPVRPLRVAFAEFSPAQSADQLPVALHQLPDGSWEVRDAALVDGSLVLETVDFSVNVPGWMHPRAWLTSVADSVTDWMTARTDPRGCADNGPDFAKLANGTTLLHSCLASNPHPDDGRVRAEAQLQSNRRFYMWVAVPDGVEYVWVEDQPAALRRMVGRALSADDENLVLLGDGTYMTAGAGRPAADADLAFASYIDGKSAALSTAGGVLGLADLSPTNLLLATALLTAQCSGEIPAAATDVGGSAELMACLVETALGNLADPRKATAAAIEHFGEAAYGAQANTALARSRDRLQLLGKVLKVLGLSKTVRDIWAQVPDAFSQMGGDRPGDVVLALDGEAIPQPPQASTDPGTFLRGFVEAWWIGQTDALSAFATPEALSEFEYQPVGAAWSDYRLNVDESCLIGSSGEGECWLTLLLNEESGFTYAIHYRQKDASGALEIYRFEAIGGGA